MGLKIEKFPSYMSPSSLSMFEKQPCKFYLLRQAPDRIPWAEAGVNAGIGTAFDFMVKTKLLTGALKGKQDRVKATVLASVWDKKEKAALADNDIISLMWKTALGPRFRTAAMHKRAQQLFKYYYETGLFEDTHWRDTEIHKRLTLPTGCPLFMKLDNVIQYRGADVPQDLKYSSISLHPGYLNRWDIKDTGSGIMAIERGAHKDYDFYEGAVSGMGLDWCTQLTTYCWGIGASDPYKPTASVVEVHMLSNTESGISIGLYRNLIPIDFQMQVMHRFQFAWDAIKTGAYLKNLPSDRFCTYLQHFNERWW